MLRLSDDWAFANETRSKSWDFRMVENELKAAVEKFNARRYAAYYPDFAIGETIRLLSLSILHSKKPKI